MSSSRRRRAVFKRRRAQKRINKGYNRKVAQKDALNRLRSALHRKERLTNAIEYLDFRRHRNALKESAQRADRQRSHYDWSEHYRRYEKQRRREQPPKAARSARTKSAPQTQQRSKASENWAAKTPQAFAELNARRRETRNKWSDDPCSDKPNSAKAARIKHSGKGKGGYIPRKWC